LETLDRLQTRITSLDELRDLFGAMRALAASHVQSAQEALKGIRSYATVVEDSIASIEPLIAEGARDDGPLPDPMRALVVVSAEHGFTGGFNGRLLEEAAGELAGDRGLVVIGQRGARRAEEMGLKPAWTYAMPTQVGGVLGVARAVSERLAACSDARVVFARYLRGGHSEVEARQIVPLDPDRVRPSIATLPPLHHLSPETLLRELVSEYLFAEITLAITESLASENGARLQIMEAADRTIGDKLEDLRRRERSLRQEAITAELLDVVTGAEAVLDQGAG
jgi:F-type H+-transporting ATPase subunit gamma